MTSKFFSQIVRWLIVILLITNFPLIDNQIAYVVFIVRLGVGALGVFIAPPLRVRLIYFDVVPAIFIATWIYGIFLGFFMNNNATFVVANFAGMSLYVIYFIMVFAAVDTQKLVDNTFFAAVVNALYAYGFTFSILFFDGRSYLLLLRMYYAPGLSVLAPFVSLMAMRLVLGNRFSSVRKYKSLGWLLFFIIPYCVLSFSKGYFASTIFIVSIIVLLLVFFTTQSLRVSAVGLSLVTCWLLGLGAGWIFYSDELRYIFSQEQSGNSTRSEQMVYLMNETTFFGQGLGAVLESGYVRNDAQPYGFELSYMSVLHKFGVFVGIIIWGLYALCLVIPLYKCLKNKHVYLSALAFGGMLFVVPSFGNPMLYSPVIVTLHCVVMYWIRSTMLNKNEE